MSLIIDNAYGAIAVNRRVLLNLIVEEILQLSDYVIPCDKKGKAIKDNPAPFIDSDLLDSVNIIEKKNSTVVTIFCIVREGNSISDISEMIFDKVYSVYASFSLEKPERVDIKIKGVMSEQLIKRNIEVSRKNDR